MIYNIRRAAYTKTCITEWPTGDRPAEKHVESVEDVTVYGTEDVLAHLTKLLEDHNVSFSRLKTCVKFKTSTKKYEDTEKQLREKFPLTR
jgi:glycine cleavage system regulatory protein